MSSTEERSKAAILALLSETRSAGLNGLTRTSLVKYLYLLDVFYAEERGDGMTWTGTEWIFHHYGPYSHALEAELDWLDRHSLLEKEERSAGAKEYVVYQTSRRADSKTLAAIGIPTSVISKLSQAIREFAYSLPKLLDYVYFRTAPMAHAHPGERLRFDDCRKISYRDDVKQLQLKALPREHADRARKLIGIIKEQHLGQRSGTTAAIYDEHYARSVHLEQHASSSDELRAALDFPEREDGRR